MDALLATRDSNGDPEVEIGKSGHGASGSNTNGASHFTTTSIPLEMDVNIDNSKGTEIRTCTFKYIHQIFLKHTRQRNKKKVIYFSCYCDAAASAAAEEYLRCK